MTIIEAMGTGLPIVATNVGGVPDMIIHGHSGLLTKLSAEAVCEACLNLAKNEQLRESFGRKAREDSLRFSADYMARQYLLQYKK